MNCFFYNFLPHLSIPLLGILGASAAEKIFGWKIFSPRDWKAAWIFGTVASLVLYPSALGLTRIDTYSWGWASLALNALVAAVAIITLVLLWKKNGFGIVLLIFLFAFAFSLKASTNFWDDLIDPIYGIISIGMVLEMIFIHRKKSFAQREC